MADPLAPQQFFNLPPTQPQSSVFGLPWKSPYTTTGQRAQTARFGLESAMDIGKARSQVNRWQQEEEEIALRETAKAHAAAALPYLQQLDPEDPDYLQKRMDVENYAPLAGLDPIAQRFLGVKDKVFSLSQTMQRRPNPAIALELDMLKNGVPEEEVEAIRGPDGAVDIRKGSAKLGEALRKNKADARPPGKTLTEKKVSAIGAELDILTKIQNSGDLTKPQKERLEFLSGEYQRLAAERLRELEAGGALAAPIAPAVPVAPVVPVAPAAVAPVLTGKTGKGVQWELLPD